MTKRWKNLIAVLAVVTLLGSVIGCSPKTTGSSDGTTKGPIRVGSKIDTEGTILGQIILQTLSANGFTVADRTRTGATQVVREALLNGQIDVYPEYTANAVLVFHADRKVDPSVLRSAAETYQTAKTEDAAVGVVWLTPAPANNTWAVALPKKFADENKIATLADLAKYINAGGDFKIAGSQEFFTSAVAFPAFEAAYGFKVTPAQVVAFATGDTAVTEKTAAEGAQGVNAAMAYGTDGSLAALGLVVLGDPLGAQPIYQPAPTFRSSIIETYPEIPDILDPVFAKLDLSTLQSLNKQVDVDGMSAKQVAGDWLKAQGFVK